jgi:3-oxoacyl-[acyl-carrier-protein] synthase III
MNQLPLRICGIGQYLPKRVLTNGDISREAGFPVGDIASRTGVETRHRASEELGESSAEMGAAAAREALDDAGIEPADLELVLFASPIQQQAIPDTAPLVQQALGIGTSGIPCFSIHGTCLGFLYALDVAANYIASGRYRRILVVTSDISSVGLNPEDSETYPLFGDAATAVVLGHAEDGISRIEGSHFATFGALAQLTRIRGGGTALPPSHPEAQDADSTFSMQGIELLRNCMRHGPQFLEQLQKTTGIELEEFRLVVPHQPSHRGLKLFQRFFPGAVLVNTLADRGNCVASSIPLGLYKAIREGILERGSRCLLIGTGAGLSFGAIALRY